MKEFENKTLNQIIVLGAHHVMARLGGINFDVLVDREADSVNTLFSILEQMPVVYKAKQVATQHLLPMMSSTQSDNIYTLLNAGVRFFDIRPFYHVNTNSLRDYHGGYGPTVEETFNDIFNFVSLNKSEFVYISIINVLTKDCEQCDTNP